MEFNYITENEKDALIEYYDKHSLKQTAKHFKTSEHLVLKALNQFDVTIHSYAEERQFAFGHIPLRLVDKDAFIKFYANHSSNLTVKQFNLSRAVFCQCLEEFNLTKHSPQEESRFSSLETYGVEYPMQSVQLQEKSKQTRLERYGDSNYNNLEKVKETKLERYGDENYNNREKANHTAMERYGVDSVLKIPAVVEGLKKARELNGCNREKARKTLMEHYGYEYALQSPECLQKLVNTCMERYGVPYNCMRPEARMKGNNSKPNRDFKALLQDYNLFVDDKTSREFVLGKYSFDFKVNNNILIEINPTSTHNSTISMFKDGEGMDKFYHYNKSKVARNNNYRCICIWDWDDKEKIVRSLLPKEKLYARKCTVREISKEVARSFIEEYHFQNYARDSIRLGLFSDNRLISVMTFGKPRYNKNCQYELIRYCSCAHVIGGAKKLFSYFIKTYEPESIVSYCDLSKFTGELYLDLGFISTENVAPSKHWYNERLKKHVTDNLLRQRGYDQLFGTSYGKGVSNEELMLKNGFLELYDCGQQTFIWEV